MSYSELRKNSPLVINLTNTVTINDVANILISIGSSPIMSEDIREANDLLEIAKTTNGVLVINIGTMNITQEQQMLEFVKIANEKDVKVILDPVGSGASEIRTNLSLKLLNEYKIHIVRGNFSEINSLMGSEQFTKGVDSLENNDKLLARKFSDKFKTAVLISGKDDFLATPTQDYKFINRGSSYLPKISGTGCMLSAIVAAYSTIHNCRLEAMKDALSHVFSASELAEKESNSTIEFKVNFFKYMEMIKDEEIKV